MAGRNQGAGREKKGMGKPLPQILPVKGGIGGLGFGLSTYV